MTELTAIANLGQRGAVAPVSLPLPIVPATGSPEGVGSQGAGDAAAWTSSEADLIRRATRDPEAFAALYQTHYETITGYIYRRVGDPHVTDDLVADVFLTAMRSLSRFRYRGIPIRAWLYRLATNSVNRWARGRRHRHATLSELSVTEVASGANSGTAGRDGNRARNALLSLKPCHQAVLALHHVEGLSVEEVATATGWRIGTVKSRLSRARDALRSKLSEGR